MLPLIKRFSLVIVSLFIIAISGCDSGVDAPENGDEQPPEVPAWSLAGAVNYGGNGLSGVTVSISLNDKVVAVARTGSQGLFQADNLADGVYTISPFKAGYIFTPEALEAEISGADIENNDFAAADDPGTVDPPDDPDPDIWSLSGSVTSGGSGLSGVSVSISQNSTVVAIAQTGLQGQYQAYNLAEGSYRITPSKDGYSFDPGFWNVSLSGADRTDINFSGTANNSTWSLGGTILCGSSGLSGVNVKISLNGSTVANVQTNSAGHYQADNLSSGTYTVTPTKNGFVFSPASLNAVISGTDSLNRNFSANADPDGGEPVRLILVGDINYGHFVEEAIKDPAKGNGDYNYPLEYVADYLKGADLTFGNLESVISDKGTDSKDALTELGYGLSLRADPGAIDGLLNAGFDVVNLANNHIGDFDFEAMEDCFSRLEAAEIDYIGAGNNYAEAHSPVIKTVNGTRIAFLGYSNVPMYADITGTSPTCKWVARGPENDDIERSGLAWAHSFRFEAYGDFNAMQDDIRAAKLQADIVIVSAHFGWEYDLKPDMPPHDEDADQQMMAHMAIDAGASLVVGHHPHVVQWLDDENTTVLENYNGGYIAYSLGNFMFDISSERDVFATHGVLLNVTIQNGVIDTIEQVNTYYLDDYWQTHLGEDDLQTHFADLAAE